MDTRPTEKELFLRVLALPRQEREGYLQRECPDEGARAAIRALLTQHSAETGHQADGCQPLPRERGGLAERIEEFRLIRELGTGGMGSCTWHGTRCSTDRWLSR